jgi:putative DNA primase/helicase
MRAAIAFARDVAEIPERERILPKSAKGARAKKATVSDWTQLIPPPADAPAPDFKAIVWTGYRLAGVWPYTSVDGRPLFYVVRFEKDDVDPETGAVKTVKVTPVVSYGTFPDGRPHWRAKGNGLNILYGLDELAAWPHAPVLIVEGEKAADAARLVFPDWVVVCWKGGASNVGNICSGAQ